MFSREVFFNAVSLLHPHPYGSPKNWTMVLTCPRDLDTAILRDLHITHLQCLIALKNLCTHCLFSVILSS